MRPTGEEGGWSPAARQATLRRSISPPPGVRCRVHPFTIVACSGVIGGSMRYTSIGITVVSLMVARVSNAQRIPITVADAQSEGATFPHDPAPAVMPAAYRAFIGSAERRCVSSARDTLATSWEALSSLRSGDLF